MLYELIYYLPRQPRMFCIPSKYTTESKAEFLKALEIAKEKGYQIEYATSEYREKLAAMNTDELTMEWGRILAREEMGKSNCKTETREFAEEVLSRLNRKDWR